jgi:NADH:ubiquinone oxidoreductase subunit F (NADH-binding)/(2Fe-2S) ferredoxin/NAD-dependent dihydropyrimidine dehydrogenase PreA subunit
MSTTTKLSLESLERRREELREQRTRERDAARARITVHLGTCGIASGAQKTLDALRAAVSERGIDDVIVTTSGCAGLCSGEPMITVERPGESPVRYLHVDPRGVVEILETHALGGGKLEPGRKGGPQPLEGETPFYARQMEIALRHRGKIDPYSLEDYLAAGGYAALARALKEMDPAGVLAEVKRSGIRGRGGGGFPTGVKWASCVEAVARTGNEPVVVCNADEGDPGAYMDRALLESDPHSVIEGMMLGAYAIGAHEGYVYVRKEYPLALDVLRHALNQARELGILGEDVLGSGWRFDIHVHQGAGAFVCGESSALMASMEGRVGEPRAKYVHNVEVGYKGRPTVLNNVETWANIPVIVERGGAWFAGIGTGDVSENPWNGSSGTKVFSLVGDVVNTGLVEVPMGITLREIIFEIGGGIPDGRAFKAVQTGGPSGGCLPEALLDEPVDFDTLTRAGSMMGSGGMIVTDDQTCMVDVARYFIEFLKDESCGKCTPCREGCTVLAELLGAITRGEGTPEMIPQMKAIAETMRGSSLCQLGATAANPVLSTLRYFEDEYRAHIEQGRCPAGVCRALIRHKITAACTGCHACYKPCPTQAISGEPNELHVIDPELCIQCGICKDVCTFDAITVQW